MKRLTATKRNNLISTSFEQERRGILVKTAHKGVDIGILEILLWAVVTLFGGRLLRADASDAARRRCRHRHCHIRLRRRCGHASVLYGDSFRAEKTETQKPDRNREAPVRLRNSHFEQRNAHLINLSFRAEIHPSLLL